MAAPTDRSSMDRCTAIQDIRKVFARSSVFRDAVISDPLVGRGGAMTIEVGFGPYPSVFRVVAPTTEEAYALLHELAASMVGGGRRPAVARHERRAGWRNPIEIHSITSA